jgi:hypothetical protein
MESRHFGMSVVGGKAGAALYPMFMHQNRDSGERKLSGGARDSRAVCGDSPQTPDVHVFVSGIQI